MTEFLITFIVGTLFQFLATRGWVDELVTWVFSILAAMAFMAAGVCLV